MRKLAPGGAGKFHSGAASGLTSAFISFSICAAAMPGMSAGTWTGEDGEESTWGFLIAMKSSFEPLCAAYAVPGVCPEKSDGTIPDAGTGECGLQAR